MKKLLISAAALAVILSAPVAMADDQNGPNNDNKKHERADNPNKGDQAGDNKMGGPNGGDAQPDRGNNRDNANDRNNNRNGNDADNKGDGNNRDNANNRGDGPDKKVVVHKTVDRNVIMKFRANIRAPHRFHFARAYVRPPGWYPHRWVFGERLPRGFFAPDYFILDFAAYGLLAPWDGYEWVRYGDDALLIDVDTGEVIRVEYDAFYD